MVAVAMENHGKSRGAALRWTAEGGCPYINALVLIPDP
jgi:hypothetical protein